MGKFRPLHVMMCSLFYRATPC